VCSSSILRVTTYSNPAAIAYCVWERTERVLITYKIKNYNKRSKITTHTVVQIYSAHHIDLRIGTAPSILPWLVTTVHVYAVLDIVIWLCLTNFNFYAWWSTLAAPLPTISIERFQLNCWLYNHRKYTKYEEKFTGLQVLNVHEQCSYKKRNKLKAKNDFKDWINRISQ